MHLDFISIRDLHTILEENQIINCFHLNMFTIRFIQNMLATIVIMIKKKKKAFVDINIKNGYI